jgi:hypothetical protein
MKLLPALLALSILAATSTAQAGALVDVNVIDRDNGSTLPTYERDGKLYVAGIPGHRYGVRIANHTNARVMAVLSVDGVNALSGETADAGQSGYVLDAWQSTDINGWRKSLSEVAQFNFTAIDNSYAAKTGRPSNVGVIGVAVFREKVVLRPQPRITDKIAADAPRANRESDRVLPSPPPPPPSAAPAAPMPGEAPSAKSSLADAATAQSSAAPSGSAAPSRADALALEKRRSAQPEETLGTGHGAREVSQVVYTQFERASSRPSEVVSVWYDSYRNLVARGVIEQPRFPADPQPFPQAFVPDPAR